MTSNPNTPSNGDDSPVDPLAEMLKNLMGGQGMGNIDPAELAKAAGLPNDPNMLQQMFAQVQAMMSSTSEGPVNWQLAHENARRVAAAGTDPSVNALQAREVDEALRLAELWLDPVTDLQATGLIGRAWSRAEWVEATLATWKRLTEPVANSIANALSDALTQQMPEEMKAMMGGTSSMLQNMGGAIFGMQLGQAIGALSAEVVSSTDIGVPLADLEMALLPANVAKFGEGLSVPENDVRLFLAVREAAHARLFVQVPWLRGHLLGAIEAYARGIHIDLSRVEDLARDLDPGNPEGIQEALSQGVFTPERTPEQSAALEKLETALALVEGWVDELTAAATENMLPSAVALRETVRRRRATGGPAEHAFSSLVGLELRPRRLREAAALWAALKDERGIAGRDAIWQHPDLLPTAHDLDDPAGFTERRRLAEASETEVDDALQKLLEGGYDAPKDEENTADSPEAPKPEDGDSPDDTEPGEPKA
ncbi:zinc-dependent metalloprotease [Arthrobacter bambusae]|uniref:Hydrolase n=1 Tax=Arthrobacter bambusae TaxID=1338426 RepID=A0AAW8DMM8_9MICC|nr:zinc-dependent metalloprotease [Arthrobacter bambusae]MDP9907603.1 putative hydrolase [Arthrobacter bambusae]MDQ0131808.1 putative hydrolase [Arthrobacter bambusae]MDQ0183220.1 putative hydrolase [Arthrobacter bambusae]